MDLLMTSQIISNGFPSSWDFELIGGISLSLDSKAEIQQRATIAAYIEKGTIPGLEATGVSWQDYLTGTLNARELDAEIRGNMQMFTDSSKFIPYYYIKNSKLQLSIQEASDVS